MAQPQFSVVIPVHNEAGNVIPLAAEIHSVLKKMGTYEIIYVNDGSTDATLAELKSLSDITIINMNRSYGQATALDAGFRAATGEYIISMDGDGQNDPADLPRMFEKMQIEHVDVITGWRKARNDTRGIRILTRIGRSLRRILIKDKVHDTGCTLRIYRAEAAKSLDVGGEMHRYILALLRWKGFTIGEMVVNDRARMHGVSKYGYSKAIRGFIDLIYVWFIYKYSQRPLHLFGYTSLVAFVLGGVSLAWSLLGKIFLNLSLNRNGWFFVGFFFILAAIMLFSFGVLIDLALRTYFAVSSTERRYYIRDTVHT